MNKATSQFLDLSRWISAMLVVITHINNRMLVNLSDIPSDARTPFTYAWGFMTGFGSQAVTVFFVLSGFLVGGKIMTQLRNNERISLRKYGVDRIARIYVVLIPAIFLIGILDFGGEYLFGSTNIYKNYDLSNHQTIASFLGTFFNLQGIFTEYWGTNGPLTTLAVEFWYYVVFPMLAAPWMSNRNTWIRYGLPILGLGLMVIWSYHNPWFGLGFVYWCIGAFARVFARPLIPCSPRIAGALLVAFLAMSRVLLRAEDLNTTINQFAYGLILCLLYINLVQSFLQSSNECGKLLFSHLHNSLADFSYSLYAIHASLLTFLCAGLEYYTGFGWKEIPAKPWNWFFVILVFIVTYLIAKIFSLITEKNTRHIRAFGYRISGVMQLNKPVRD